MGALKDTTVSLQFADRSIKYASGVVEDVLVKVDKLIFPADFVVLEMEEDVEIPIILGRPFLATEEALIDVREGKLVLRLEGEYQVTFNVFKKMKYPIEPNDVLRVELVDVLVRRVAAIEM